MKYTAEILTEILDKHAKWLLGEKGGERADLSYSNLRHADLRCANLRSANLSHANLSYSNLSCADLSYSNLSCADLRHADLRCANLRSANPSYCDLSYSNLSCADLSYSDLSYSNLSCADLRFANLSYANLSYADLRCAKNFDPLSIEGFNFAVCPAEGAFIGYKRVNTAQGEEGILVLEIQADSPRISTCISRKCRAQTVRVLRAETMDGSAHSDTEFVSTYDNKFVYHVGELATAADYDSDIHRECTRGIHFFPTRKDAAEY